MLAFFGPYLYGRPTYDCTTDTNFTTATNIHAPWILVLLSLCIHPCIRPKSREFLSAVISSAGRKKQKTKKKTRKTPATFVIAANSHILGTEEIFSLHWCCPHPMELHRDYAIVPSLNPEPLLSHTRLPPLSESHNNPLSQCLHINPQKKFFPHKSQYINFGHLLHQIYRHQC